MDLDDLEDSNDGSLEGFPPAKGVKRKWGEGGADSSSLRKDGGDSDEDDEESNPGAGKEAIFNRRNRKALLACPFFSLFYF